MNGFLLTFTCSEGTVNLQHGLLLSHSSPCAHRSQSQMFFFPPFHHISHILHTRAEWLHTPGFSVMSCPRKECVSGHLKGYSCVSLPFFLSLPPAEVIKGLLVNRYSCSLTCANCFMPSAACALDFDIEKIRDREERAWYPLWYKNDIHLTCDHAFFTRDCLSHMWLYGKNCILSHKTLESNKQLILCEHNWTIKKCE